MLSGRILIVDDEVGQLETLRLYLEPLPIKVEVAEGTAQALRLLGAERFHAIVCDLVMPGGGGTEILRFVRSRGLQTPVLIVTG